MRRSPAALLGAALALACIPASIGPGSSSWTPPAAPALAAALVGREPCAHREPLRQPLFGDLHVHTRFSMDASARGLAKEGPDFAYRFASGHEVSLPPYDARGVGTRRVRIDRPLDFAAATDHAEWMGEVSLCMRPGSSMYATRRCRQFRGEASSAIPGVGGMNARMMGIISLSEGRPAALCGRDGGICRAELRSAWELTRAAAERWYDRTSECRFTTFAAWEYSASPGRSKVHRNVILRNELAPELPISWLDVPDAEQMWARLRALCNDTGTGCEALAIPHNPNLSNGQMFSIPWRDAPLAEQRERARLRAEMEPVVEMMQHKGESECRNGMYGVVGGADELCDFEKARGLGAASPPDCGEGSGEGALMGEGCISRLDFVRYALLEGLREQQRTGVNPYRLGFIGSTDNHSAAPGSVNERRYLGGNAARDATLADRLDGKVGGTSMRPALRNPGGLAGVWAEENTRDAIFDAIRRRETFATSGPRIAPRFFAGWGYPADICTRADLVERGYAEGVPMGGELRERLPGAGPPAFVVSALRDAGSEGLPGTQLQRLQVIKGFVGDDGAFHQEVHDVAGAAGAGGVDPRTCTPQGSAFDSLCARWTDPDFDPARPAVYYARVVEAPSCRWQAAECVGLAGEERPAGCDDPALPDVIQERAWTSPIWYRP